MSSNRFDAVLNELMQYVEQRDFSGPDPYDGLKVTSLNFIHKNYWANRVVSHLFKQSPFDFRSVVGVKPTKMPKAAGIFLNAYSELALANDHNSNHYKDKADELFNWLEQKKIKEYSGDCWNFGFPYAFMADKPTVVITSIICKGYFKYHELTGNEAVVNSIHSMADFVLKDLHRTETKEGTCFSYSPVKNHMSGVFNASLLAAEVLARSYFHNKDEKLIPIIKRTIDQSIAFQKEDGRWNYSVNFDNGNERAQIDFHQGYVLESLYEILELTGLMDEKYEAVL